MTKHKSGKEHNALVSGQAGDNANQLQGGAAKEGRSDMDVFDENTAPYSVGGNQGETSSVEAGQKMVRKNLQHSQNKQ